MQNTIQKRNGAVSLARITAMLMILVCHTAEHSVLSQLGTTGISVFLLISGYLYGTRDIPRPLSFLKKRYMTVTFPAVVFVSGMAIYYWFHARNDSILPAWLLFVFNLQGLNKLYSRIPQINMGPGVMHLWFLTALMLCYLLMLPIKKAEKSHPLSRTGCQILLAVSSILVLLCGFGEYKLRLNLIQIFFFGYWYAQQKIEMTEKKFALWTGVTLFSAVPMWLLLRYLPDSGWYVGVGYLWRNLLGIWIFFAFLFLQLRVPAMVDRLGSLRIVRHIDKLSYYVFIVHFLFSDGPFRVFDLPVPKLLQYLVFAALTLLCAEILMALCSPVIRMTTQNHPAKKPDSV